MTARPASVGREHVTALDGVRAVAAYGVIATHAGFVSGRSIDHGPFAPFLARLDFGVTLFFLLSGFLLFRPFAASAISDLATPRIGSFWWRRALRILPAYWLVIAVTLGLLSYRHASTGDWFSYLLMVQTYDGLNIDSSLSQMWTLAVEISFYAALPLLAAVPRLVRGRCSTVNRQLILLLALAAAALAANLAIHAAAGASPTLLWLPAYLDWFALGMLLAVASCVSPAAATWRRVLGDWSTSPGTCWALGALLFWIATLRLCGPYDLLPDTTWEWTIKHYLYGLAAFFFLLPIVLGDPGSWPHRLLGNRVSRWLGEISYGVFLWHLPLLIFIQRRMHWRVFGGHFLALFAMTAGTATAVAALSWYLIERPVLRRYSRPWRRAKQRAGGQGDGQDAQELGAGAVGQRVH